MSKISPIKNKIITITKNSNCIKIKFYTELNSNLLLKVTNKI